MPATHIIRFRSEEFHTSTIEEKGDVLADFVNNFHDPDIVTLSAIYLVGIAIYDTSYMDQSCEQRMSVLRIVSQAVMHSTFRLEEHRRALAQDALTEAVSILTNKRASLDGEYSSDDRNEAALIASRMPIIIAQTYAEL